MTVDDAKAYLRLETGQEDALIARLVASAQALCEAFTGQVLVRREVTEALRGGGAWQRLSAVPVAAVTAVSDADGTVLPAERYAIDIDADGEGWVRASVAVRVTYRAGIADDEHGVPPALAQGITRMAAHLYAHRDDLVGPPTAVAALWRPFRKLRLGMERRA
jgi:uncharacterized phiE125 gp8 family phage protein